MHSDEVLRREVTGILSPLTEDFTEPLLLHPFPEVGNAATPDQGWMLLCLDLEQLRLFLEGEYTGSFPLKMRIYRPLSTLPFDLFFFILRQKVINFIKE